MANFEKYQTSDKSAEDIGEFVHSTLAQDMTWDTISWIRRFLTRFELGKFLSTQLRWPCFI